MTDKSSASPATSHEDAFAKDVKSILLKACPQCDYDEAEGILIDHCKTCCHRIVGQLWERTFLSAPVKCPYDHPHVHACRHCDAVLSARSEIAENQVPASEYGAPTGRHWAPGYPLETTPSARGCTKVEILGHEGKAVSARCILSGCQDFTPHKPLLQFGDVCIAEKRNVSVRQGGDWFCLTCGATDQQPRCRQLPKVPA